MTKNEAAITTVNTMITELEKLGLDEHRAKIIPGVGIANLYSLRAIDALKKLADQLGRCPEW